MSNFLANELHRSNYRLLGLVGQGQFGRVYCATHRKNGRLVALKELDRSRFSTHNFLRELRFLLSLQHSNIVTCQALEHTATGRYLVMDYCEGGTLRSLLDEDVQLNPQQGIQLILQILAGLEHAHQRGIVHCDIKPENILLTVTAEGWTARITDFGIARLSQEIAAGEGFSTMGSPAYMAPERFYGQYSPASDLYAVGILLFELLVGSRPFSGAPADLMSAHLNQGVKFPNAIPDDLKSVLLHALQKLPARRFRTASEMGLALRAAIDATKFTLADEWESCIVLRPSSTLAQTAIQPIPGEALEHPVFRLVGGNLPTVGGTSEIAAQTAGVAHAGATLYRIFGCSVEQQLYPKADSTVSLPAIAVHLQEAIVDLVVRPQGCFAITQQAIYLLPWALFERELSESTLEHREQSQRSQFDHSTSAIAPQLLTILQSESLVTIEASGRWMAQASTNAKKKHRELSIWNLQSLHPFAPAVRTGSAAKHAHPAATCFQLLALDVRHLALFSHTTDPGSTYIAGMLVEIFTRRGTLVAALELPIPLRSLCATLSPYRLLGIEPGHPKSLLFLDLKPLKIQRIGLDLIPHFLVSMVWGYVVMAINGQMVLLNLYGQILGRVAGPENPTAIAPLDDYRLAIATQHDQQNRLFIVDIPKLDLDIVF